MDASVLDERVTYTCSQPWKYQLSPDPVHQDALAFYHAKWGTQIFREVLEDSTEYVCWGIFYYYFMSFAVVPLTLYIVLTGYTYMMKCFFLRRNRRPLRALFCTEYAVFDLITNAEMLWFFLSLYPSVTEANSRLIRSVGSVREFFEFQANSHII